MIKKTIFLALIAAACSCYKNHETAETAREPSGVEYSFTRAVAPADRTTYTFASYKADKNGDYGPNPDMTGGQKPVGNYAYLDDPVYKGIFQPCIVGAGHKFVSVHAQSGQALLDGTFRTVCIHPAVGFTSHSSAELMAVRFERGDEVHISEPFDMKISGYTLVPLPSASSEEGLPLRDLRSKVVFDIVKGNARTNFTISDFSLENAGEWGWYMPMSRETKIAYIASEPENIYDKDNNPTQGNIEPLTVSQSDPAAGDGDLYHNAAATGVNDVVYTTGNGAANGFFFFSNDYTTDTCLTPRLAMNISFDGGATSQVMRIPFSIKMKGGTRYRFKLTVLSVAIRVTFTVVEWDGADDAGNPIGGGVDEIHLGTWTVEGWQPGNGGSTEGIGGTNP